ncbi:hypothetical protein [Streptomyces cucumeris]|uniref:hypothetical protein n=1 Tax=Streptomyces cucumeris TaxID=2962890 RepID=UPI003D747332
MADVELSDGRHLDRTVIRLHPSPVHVHVAFVIAALAVTLWLVIGWLVRMYELAEMLFSIIRCAVDNVARRRLSDLRADTCQYPT